MSIRSISLCSSKCSSRSWLLSSTTSIGSMKEVLPEADSSNTIPGTFFLLPEETGMSILPSRTDTEASESATPSS